MPSTVPSLKMSFARNYENMSVFRVFFLNKTCLVFKRNKLPKDVQFLFSLNIYLVNEHLTDNPLVKSMRVIYAERLKHW